MQVQVNPRDPISLANALDKVAEGKIECISPVAAKAAAEFLRRLWAYANTHPDYVRCRGCIYAAVKSVSTNGLSVLYCNRHGRVTEPQDFCSKCVPDYKGKSYSEYQKDGQAHKPSIQDLSERPMQNSIQSTSYFANKNIRILFDGKDIFERSEPE